MGALKTSTVVRRVIAAARKREGDRWTPDQELTANLAVRMAGQLDSASSVSDVVRLTREVRALVAELAPPAPQRPTPDEDGEPDDIDRELADIVGRGPEMGDAPYA